MRVFMKGRQAIAMLAFMMSEVKITSSTASEVGFHFSVWFVEYL